MGKWRENADRAALMARVNIGQAADALMSFQADLAAGGDPIVAPLELACRKLRLALHDVQRATGIVGEVKRGRQDNVPPIVETLGEQRIWRALTNAGGTE